MATSETTNLQLVKYGAGTDNFIRTDYNGNLDKIDTFAGNTNEAIATLNNFTAVTFTPETGITNNLFIRRYGRVVIVNGYLTASSALGQGQLVGTIESGHRPVATVRFLVGVANAAYEIGEIAYGAIGDDGKVRITTKSGNAYKSCYFSASYIVQS